MTTIAMIQARMSSSRFPGKVLEELAGRPAIAFMVERVRRAKTIDKVVVLTSTDTTDDAIAEAARKHQFEIFRGDLHDVLLRYEQAADHYGASTIVRLTGDCPLIDPCLVDMVVRAREEASADYSSNTEPPTFADGMDVECFTRAALHRAGAEALTGPEREHVTVWMRAKDSPLRRVNVESIFDSAHLRLTVDYPDDLEVIRRLVAGVGRPPQEFDYFDLLRCIDAERGLMALNHHARNEGLALSISQANAIVGMQDASCRE